MGVPLVAIAITVAAATSAVVGGLALFLGRRVGFVDRPDAQLKTHTGTPVPLGGAAVLVGLHVGMSVAGVFDLALLVASLLVWVLGLLDDRIGLSPSVRLLGAGLAGFALVFIQGMPTGWLARGAAVALVVVAVNAVNLLDGLDGLAGSATGVAALGLAAFGVVQGVATAWAPAVLAAAILGFLIWNLPPARLFLGDNGSYVIGVAIAWAALRAASDWSAGLLAVALVGVPLIDLGATILRRFRTGSPLFSGDRDHSYDRAHQAGLSAGVVAGIYALAQGLWAALLIAVSVVAGDVAAIVASVVAGGSITVWIALSGPRISGSL